MGLLYFHKKWIQPEILRRWRPTILEIGAQAGEHTKPLLAACSRRLGRLVSIDPGPADEIKSIIKRHFLADLMEEPSLEALPKLVQRGFRADVAIIDGDHNYYTVSNELKLVEKLLKKNGIIFLHDTSWPYGRRDLYYDPDRIPADQRHPFARRGIVAGQSELSGEGGQNAHLCNAVYEGGAKNGVLTAIEDFVAEACGRWMLELRNEEFGLGILRRNPSPDKP